MSERLKVLVKEKIGDSGVELLSEHFGEDKGMRDMRKHIAWC